MPPRGDFFEQFVIAEVADRGQAGRAGELAGRVRVAGEP
jgi:hypothetical protein